MKKLSLDYLEYDIVNSCNLNCKGCTHFCNIIKEKETITKEIYEKDLKRLKEFVEEIKLFRIMGGEPLLNKDIIDIIKITRKYYSSSKIHLVTNGLNILKMNQLFFDILNTNSIEVHISLYKENDNIIKDIIKKLKDNNIKYSLDYNFGYFKKFILNNKSSESGYKLCQMKTCHNLYNGYLNVCAIANYIDRLNKRFNTDYPITSINIHDKNMNVSKIDKILNNPSKMCNYCTCYGIPYKRTIANYKTAKIEDYVITDEEEPKGKKYYKLDNNIITKVCKSIGYRVCNLRIKLK